MLIGDKNALIVAARCSGYGMEYGTSITCPSCTSTSNLEIDLADAKQPYAGYDAETAEELKVPVILQAGPGCRANTPLPVLGKMFRYLAEQSSSPIVCHLDHGYQKKSVYRQLTTDSHL